MQQIFSFLKSQRFRYIILTIILALAFSFFIAQKKHSRTYKVFSAPVENSVSGKYLAARFAEGENDWVTAYQSIKSTLAKEPGNTDMMDIAMRLAVRLEDMNEAARLALRIVKEEPQNELANIVLISYYLHEGQAASAEKILEPLVKNPSVKDINSLILNLVNVWTLAEKKNYSAALAKLDAIIAGNGGIFNQFLHYQAALIADLGGMKPRAEKEYGLIVKSSGHKSYRFVEGAISFYQRDGKKDMADKLYERYMKRYLTLSPNSSLPLSDKPIINNGSEGIAELFAEIGAFLNDNGFNDEAIEYLRLSLYLRPDLPHAQYILADILSTMGQYKPAIKIYEKINPTSPYSWHGRLRIAYNLEKIGSVNEAKSLLESLAQENSNSYQPLVSLGDLYLHQERYAEAARTYTEALEKIKNPESVNWVIYYSRGAAYEKMDKWDKAEQDLLTALNLEPDQPDVLNYLAFSWVEKGKHYKEAKEMLEKALKERPDEPHIIDSYGWVLYRLGDYKGATEYLERAIMLMPYDSIVNDHLGDVYWMDGRKDEAKFQWSRALSLNPTPSDVVELKRKLEHGLNDEGKANNQ